MKIMFMWVAASMVVVVLFVMGIGLIKNKRREIINYD
jgi:hypothetical protein